MPQHPILVALQDTVQRHALTQQPFVDLLDAFRQDQTVNRYVDDAQLIDYCRRSANPVGRILLQLAQSVTPTTLSLSDAVCTGLQLANFCQDMARDAEMGRIYLPRSRWAANCVQEAMLLKRRVTPELRQALAAWVATARQYLLDGWPLVQHVPRWLRTDVDLFVRGGLAILQAIEAGSCDVWTRRRTVSKWTQTRLFVTAVLPTFSPATIHHPSDSQSKENASTSQAVGIAHLEHREPESPDLRQPSLVCASVPTQSKQLSGFLCLARPRATSGHSRTLRLRPCHRRLGG